MNTAMKIVIAVIIVVVFALVYIGFFAGASGDAGSFLENFWNSIISMIQV